MILVTPIGDSKLKILDSGALIETQRWEGQNSKNESLEVSRKISN